MVPMLRILSVALVSLSLLAGSASAECAWVLWTKDPALGVGADKNLEWRYTALGPEVFDTRAECEKVSLKYRANRLKAYGDAKKAGIDNPIPPALAYQCLPDTMDPRGPKAR